MIERRGGRSLRRLGGLSLTAFLLGCAPKALEKHATQGAHISPATPLSLLPVDAYPEDFQWRQRVTARWPSGERSFAAVMSKADGKLRLIGLDPMGRPGFVLEHADGERVRVESHPSVQFPFDPQFILLDIQRVFYPWFEAPMHSSQIAQERGEQVLRTTTRAGSVIEERYSLAGQLMRRTFFLEGSPAQKEATVVYEYERPQSKVAARATYQNHLHGYALRIVMLDAQQL